jgi:hypothetical protein
MFPSTNPVVWNLYGTFSVVNGPLCKSRFGTGDDLEADVLGVLRICFDLLVGVIFVIC